MLKGQKKVYRERLLYEGLLTWASKEPERTAIYGIDRKVSYGQLLADSLGLCRTLLDMGVRPGDRVIVNLKRGIPQIETILGVLLAGGVYVPVGAHQPPERVKSIAEQSCAKVVVSGELEPAEGSLEDIAEIFPESEAYIIFTSGSTGKPKGVRISHKAAMNTIDCVNDYFGVDKDDTAIAVSQMDFDLSVYDIFGMLSAGGSIALLSDDAAKEPQVWKERIVSCGVTLWNSVPALFDMLVTSFEGREVFGTLKKVFLSGDWVPLDIFARMKQVTPGASLVAMGGAIEASIWSNYHVVTGIDNSWTSVPYGVPLADQSFIIMDENGSEVTDGSTGELWIGGKGVAIGYTDEELTRASFVEYAGERFYRTGDYGRLMENGEMEFCGRRDQQVKLNGFRVEIGEIERVLAGYEGVAKAAAAVTEDKHIAGGIVPAIGNGKPASDKEYPLTYAENSDTAQMRQVVADVLNGAEVCGEYAELAGFYRNFAESGSRKMPESPYMKRLMERRDVLSGILSGRESVHQILEDDVLSPEAAAFSDPETVAALEKMVQEIKGYCNGKTDIRAALVGSQRGLAAEYLLENLSGISLDVITSGSAFTMQTSERVRRFENCSVIRVDVLADYHKLYAGYDIVVSVHGLHTYEDETMAGRIHAFLLKNGGKLYAIEQTMLRPEAYLTSMLIENGFSRLCIRRKRTMNPMLPAEEWTEILENCGLTGGVITGDSNVYLSGFANENTALSPEDLAEYASQRLPYYMVPQKIYIVPEWNYSSNGKVKKDFYITSSDSSDEAAESFEEMEAEVAEMFRNVLKKENVQRSKSFFEMGGDSLLLTRLLTMIKDRYQMDYSMKDAYDKPYIPEFAEKISDFISGCTDFAAIEEGEI